MSVSSRSNKAFTAPRPPQPSAAEVPRGERTPSRTERRLLRSDGAVDSHLRPSEGPIHPADDPSPTTMSTPQSSSRACERCQFENTTQARFCLQCGAMLETTAAEQSDPLIGRVLLHRYRIVSELGEGGMGKVYLAEQKMGTAVRKVAIKTLHPELSGDPQLVARFHRECETVIELQHPNTIKFYDFGELEDKTLFIVMEYIQGGDLAQRLQTTGAVTPALADKLLIQICGSLHEAHERGVVHRDLKPENILLTTRGGQTDFVKVLDFGIAKRSEAEDEKNAKLTKQGMVLGTPPYMSPEQFSGQTLDLRSDIYSLGVVTYEMVTGHLPFEAKTPWEWATKHLTVQPTPIESYPGGAALPEAKRQVIMRSLSKNRDERQANALVFMHEFTGMADPQVAWTMATTTGLNELGSSPGTNPGSNPGVAPVGAVGTGPHPTPAPHAYHPTPTPAPTDFASGTLPSVPTSGGGGKWVLISLVALVVITAAAGGAWLMSRPTEVATNTDVTVPTNTPPAVNPVTPVTPMVDPTMGFHPIGTPMVETPMVETPMVETPMVETPMVEVAEMDTPRMSTMRRTMRTSMMSARNQAAAIAQIAQVGNLINSRNVPGAIRAYREASRVLGRNDARVASAREDLTRRGPIAAGNAAYAGNCRQATQILRGLRGAGIRVPRDYLGDACD